MSVPRNSDEISSPTTNQSEVSDSINHRVSHHDGHNHNDIQVILALNSMQTATQFQAILESSAYCVGMYLFSKNLFETTAFLTSDRKGSWTASKGVRILRFLTSK